MATIASLVVNIAADTSDIVRNTARGADAVESFAAKATRAASAFASLWAVREVVQFAQAVEKTADEFDKLAQRLEDSTDNIQKLKAISQEYDVSLDAMVSGIQTLQMRLGDGSINAALAKLNINVAEFKASSPVDQYVAMAEALGRIEDPAQRAAIANQLLGRNAKELAASFRESITETDAWVKASPEAIALWDGMGTSIDKATTSLHAFAMELTATITGIKALEGIRNFTTMGGPQVAAPGQFSPTNTGTVAAPEALDEINRDLTEQAKIMMEINAYNDIWAHHWADAPIVFGPSIVQMELLKMSTIDLVGATNALTEAYGISAARQEQWLREGMERAKAYRAETDALIKGMTTGVATTEAAIQTALGTAAPPLDAAAAAMERYNQGVAALAEKKLIPEDEAVAMQLLMDQWNADMALVNLGADGIATKIDSAATATERATLAAHQLAGAYSNAAGAAQAFYGYVDQSGRATTQGASEVLANMPGHMRTPFGGGAAAGDASRLGMGGTSVVNNVTLNGAIGAGKEDLRRMIEELLTERATQGRLRSGAR